MRNFQTVSIKEKKKSNTQLTNDSVFIEQIVSYYTEHGRHDLIWRKKITAYRILVSEVMLQQTQVGRVLPKFKEWMSKYPSLATLKTSTLKDILILWQGLGYQRRAKYLHTISMSVKVLPKTFDELRTLPGIGKYTASAICAFAYDTFAYPLLETNIRTVLIEHFYMDEDQIDDTTLINTLYRLETYEIVQKIGARHFYYALMDYGAYLKQNKISHNIKSKGYRSQTKFKGSLRELRASTLFAIVHKNPLPEDERTDIVVGQLLQEGFIRETKNGYVV